MTELLKLNPDYVPAMLSLAVGKFIQKKTTDAKNILKTLWKRPYASEFGDDMERAWLLYADSFVAVKLLFIISKN